MLFLLRGSSACGKTTLARIVEQRVPNLVVHEMAELTPTSWTNERAQTWRQR